MNEYKLIFDTGEVAIVQAKSRGRAIESYCAGRGIPVDWVKAHCIVRNLGRVPVWKVVRP